MSLEKKWLIIIVNYNTALLTLKAIKSIYKSNINNFDIIVIDNNSSDKSVKLISSTFPSLQMIVNKTNVGYAKANNQAIRLTQNEYILLMNSDTEMITQHALQKLQQHFEKEQQTGIVGAVLLNSKKKIQSAGRPFLTLSQMIKKYLFCYEPNKIQNSSTSYPVDYVDGAFLAIRRSAIKNIGYMDDNFFLFAEDMDWCKRAWLCGWQVRIAPQILVLHHHGASSTQDFTNALISNGKSIYYYMQKYNPGHAQMAFIVFCIALGLRIPLAILRHTGLAGDYWRALKCCIQLLPRLETLNNRNTL
ncbi:MAG: glycosyltransferase family 2 protein [candidate division KSB1 bacterium]|nr:glycosyltransferase family 2 protein [candidate division KSB1 bacterium]